MELLAWELGRPNAVTWGLWEIEPENYSFVEMYRYTFKSVILEVLSRDLTRVLEYSITPPQGSQLSARLQF